MSSEINCFTPRTQPRRQHPRMSPLRSAAVNYQSSLHPPQRSSPSPRISFKNTIIQAIEMTHEQDN